MKKILLFFGMIFFLTACEPNTKQGLTVHRDPNLLHPVSVTITPEIEKDPELLEMVQSSEKAINELSDNIENIADEAKVFLEEVNKKEGEMSIGDMLRAGKLITKFSMHSSSIMKTTKKLEAYVESRKEQGTITDEQIEAIDQVSKALTNRLKELGKKYEKLFDELK